MRSSTRSRSSGRLLLLQPLGGAAELAQGLAPHLLPGVQLGQLEAAGDVLRVQVHHLLQGGEGGPGVALALVVAHHHLEEGHRLGHQPQLLVQLGQLEIDLHQVGIELEDLLVEGDRLEEETVLGVDLGDAGEERGGLRVVTLLLVQLSHLLEHAHVAWIQVEYPLVLPDRFLEGALGDKLGGALDDLVLVHRPGRARRRLLSERPRNGGPRRTRASGSRGVSTSDGNVSGRPPSRNVPVRSSGSPRGYGVSSIACRRRRLPTSEASSRSTRRVS